MKPLRAFLIAAPLAASICAAQAKLHDRGGGLIYDSARNVTWLADFNYAFTSGYAEANADASGRVQPDGRMRWDAARAWAEGLSYGGYDDWRLPTLDPSDTTCSNRFDPGGGYPLQYYGVLCTGGELSGLLVVELGNSPGRSVLDQEGDSAEQRSNLALFLNLKPFRYWSSTKYEPDIDQVWVFNAEFGNQGTQPGFSGSYAAALRYGDVSAVSEPPAWALALLGGAGLLAFGFMGSARPQGGAVLLRGQMLAGPVHQGRTQGDLVAA